MNVVYWDLFIMLLRQCVHFLIPDKKIWILIKVYPNDVKIYIIETKQAKLIY